MNSLPTALPQADAGFQPYIGLKPFTEQEKDRFFGRDREISILLDKIRANRLTLLLAASGVGKSSLLQAGIMPALRTDSNIELIYHRDWAASPQAFKQAVSDHYGEPHKDNVSLKSILRACTLFSSGQQIILLDQFEEFFNYQRFRAEFLPFIEELSAAILDRSLPASFVFSMREDFALELNSFKPFLPGVFDSYFRLEKLTRDQARLAIEEPLKPTGWRFEQDGSKSLLEEVLNDLAKREQERQFGVEELRNLNELPLLVEPPHLQIVCQELWRHHRDEADKQLWLYHRGEAVKQITHAAYQESGRAKGILETYFLRKIGQFNKKEQALASAAFDHLVGQRATKVAYPLERLAELTRADANTLKLVLDKLQDCAVLRRQKRGEEFWYELYHDIFSESIKKWNQAFKRQRRYWQRVITKMAVLIVVGLPFAANWRTNYYARYLQTGISDMIEVYQGTQDGLDLFRRRRFRYETSFRRQDLEADKRFGRSIVEDRENAQANLVGRLPLLERLPRYAENGLYGKVDELAKNILGSKEDTLINSLPVQLANVRTKKSVTLLSDERQDKKKVVAALAQLVDIAAIVKLLSDADDSVRQSAAKALGNSGDRSVAPELVKLLTDKHMFVRQSAVEALSNLGDRSIAPEFVKLLRDEEENVRKAAAKALVQISTNSFAPKLIEFLEGENETMWQKAWEILDKLGDRSITPELVKLLADTNENVRAFAAKALGMIGDRSITPELVNLLTDKDGGVRIGTAEALGELGDSSVASELVKLLADENDNVRWSAAQSLDQLDDRSFTPEFLKLLTDENDNVRWSAAYTLVKWNGSSFALKLLADKNSGVRNSAAYALGDLGDRSVVPELVKLLADENENVRQAAAEALGNIGDSSVVPELVKLLADENENVRQAAAEALGNIGDSSVVPELVKLLADADASVRRYAIKAIDKLGNRSVVPELIKLVVDKNANVRQAAAEALGNIGDSAVVPELVKLIADKDSFVRSSAAKALSNMGDRSVVPELVKLLADDGESVRQAAVEALDKLKTVTPILKPALAYVEEELRQLEHDKAAWRAQRDRQDTAERSDDSSKLEDDVHWQLREYRIGSALARIAPTERGIELLDHPLHHIRQGAVRALAGKADAALIDKIIQEHQNFNPDDLPSPFPYTAFQAIDLALWNLEYTGKQEDVTTLQDIRAHLKPCRVPGQEGAIEERLEWTIKRLEEKYSQQTGEKNTEAHPQPARVSP